MKDASVTLNRGDDRFTIPPESQKLRDPPVDAPHENTRPAAATRLRERCARRLRRAIGRDLSAVATLTDPLYLAVKVGAAAGLAVLLAHVARVPDALSCGFVGLVCVTPTVYAGLRRGLEQLGGAALAGIITTPLALVGPTHPAAPVVAVQVALATGLVAAACHRLRWGGGYTVAGFTALYLRVLPFSSLAEALRVRFVAVLLGVAVATAVNLVVAWTAAAAIRERRVRLARAAVADPLRRAAAACVEPAQRAAAAAAWRPAFAAVEELRADLAAQARELLLPHRGAVRAAAARDLAALDGLADLAHLGRHVCLLLAASERPEPAAASALTRAADALLAASPAAACDALAAAAAGTPDAALATALRLMAGTLRAALPAVRA